MSLFSIPNTPGVKRLHIGVFAPDGSYAEMNFTAQDKYSPLVADEPAELQAEIDCYDRLIQDARVAGLPKTVKRLQGERAALAERLAQANQK